LTATAVQQANEPAHKTVLLTGCLQLADTKEYFTLKEAGTVPQTPPGQTSPSRSVPQAAKQAAERIEYELRPASGVAESGVDAKRLGQHVGQRVEVTARPTDDTAPAPPDPKVTTEQPKPRDEVVQKIRLTVTDIRSLGMSCQ
jgi:hypothetical protein